MTDIKLMKIKKQRDRLWTSMASKILRQRLSMGISRHLKSIGSIWIPAKND